MPRKHKWEGTEVEKFFDVCRKAAMLVTGRGRPGEGKGMDSRPHRGKQVKPSHGVSWNP